MEELREQLHEMEIKYNRLWKFNLHRGFKDLHIRVFCLALCAFEPLSPTALTDALRIDPAEHSLINRDLRLQDVTRLHYNFLVEDSRGLLGFSHGAARTFVSTLLKTQGFAPEYNHAYVAKLYIQAMKKPVHFRQDLVQIGCLKTLPILFIWGLSNMTFPSTFSLSDLCGNMIGLYD